MFINQLFKLPESYRVSITIMAVTWIIGLTFLAMSFMLKPAFTETKPANEINEQQECAEERDYLHAMPFPLLPALEAAANNRLQKLRELAR